MKDKIKQLAIASLIIPQVPQNYTPQDLLNASLVFTHFFSDLSWQHNEKIGFTQEQREQLAIEFGKSIRQTILLATGCDMHEEANK